MGQAVRHGGGAPQMRQHEAAQRLLWRTESPTLPWPKQGDVLHLVRVDAEGQAQSLVQPALLEIFAVDLAALKRVDVDHAAGRDYLARDPGRGGVAPDVPLDPETEKLLVVVGPVEPDGHAAEPLPILRAREKVGEAAVERLRQDAEGVLPEDGIDGGLVDRIEETLDLPLVAGVAQAWLSRSARPKFAATAAWSGRRAGAIGRQADPRIGWSGCRVTSASGRSADRTPQIVTWAPSSTTRSEGIEKKSVAVAACLESTM